MLAPTNTAKEHFLCRFIGARLSSPRLASHRTPPNRSNQHDSNQHPCPCLLKSRDTATNQAPMWTANAATPPLCGFKYISIACTASKEERRFEEARGASLVPRVSPSDILYLQCSPNSSVGRSSRHPKHCGPVKCRILQSAK